MNIIISYLNIINYIFIFIFPFLKIIKYISMYNIILVLKIQILFNKFKFFLKKINELYLKFLLNLQVY
jgi:hypothetical protein